MTESVSDFGTTTRRVYRFIFRTGRPVGIREIQRGLELSSVSVAEYHVRKLLSIGAIKEVDGKYKVDQILYDSLVKLGSFVVPLQSAYLMFFVTSFVLLLTAFRPQSVNSLYAFAVLTNLAALVEAISESIRVLRAP